MSNRTTLRPQAVIGTVNGVNSGISGNMAADITSKVTILGSITGISYQLAWTGTSPVGTAAVQVSDDYALNPDGSVRNAGTWTTVYINVNGVPAASAAISGNTGNGFIDVVSTMAYAARLFYDNTSGVGTLTAVVNGKVA